MPVGSLKQCDLCEYETTSREKFAGHRSSHVRRGELAKRIFVKKTEHPCPNCEKTFRTGMALSGHSRFHRNISIDELKTSGTRKFHLIAKRGHRCEKCGNTEWCNKLIPITLDHIDGNSDNNVEDNLRLLCPNCHAQTPTFSGRNIGRFTASKRNRNMKAYRYHQRNTQQIIGM